MDRKLRIEAMRTLIFLGKVEVFCSHQTPPNLTRGWWGWVARAPPATILSEYAIGGFVLPGHETPNR